MSISHFDPQRTFGNSLRPRVLSVFKLKLINPRERVVNDWWTDISHLRKLRKFPYNGVLLSGNTYGIVSALSNEPIKIKGGTDMRQLRQVITAMVVFTAAVIFATTGHAAETAKPHRIAIQIDQNDPALMNLLLNNVSNVAEYYNSKGGQVQIEVVAYGPGLNMLREDKSPVKDRIKRINEASFPSTVNFTACGKTMEAMEKQEGHPIMIVPEASVVPAGVVRLSELQEQGWSYIRP